MEINNQPLCVKIPKVVIFTIILLFSLFNSGIIIFIYLYNTRETSIQWNMLALIVGCVYFIVAWLFPIWLIGRIPKQISIESNELCFLMRFGTKRIISRNQIHDVRKVKDNVSREEIYTVHLDKKNPDVNIPFDKSSGQYIYDWYQNRGQLEK